MKRLVVDDERWFKFPDADTTYARSTHEATKILLSGEEFDEVWLDHDMGKGNDGGDVYNLANELEMLVGTTGERLPVGRFVIHSQNPVRAYDMAKALERFYNVNIASPLQFALTVDSKRSKD